MTLKVAALVLSYRYPAGIAALARYFAAGDVDMFIHVDKKIDDAPFRQAAGSAGVGNNVFLQDRVEMFWRGFTMIEASIRLVLLAKSSRRYDRYLIISDDSLPLVTPADLCERLQFESDYLAAVPAPGLASERYDRFFMFDSRATQVRWIPVVDREVTLDTSRRLTRLDALRERGKKPLDTYYSGSQWMGLTSAAVDLILESWAKDDWLRESFEFSEVPDESYFHTILSRAIWQPLTYVDWSTPLPPRIFKTIEEISSVNPKGAMFLRKVDLSAMELDLWIRMLLEKSVSP